MSAPVVVPYQQALDGFRREGREPALLKRMSELISLLDLSTTLGSRLGGAERLDAALLIVMGELGVSRGALYVAEGPGRYRRRAARGGPADAPELLEGIELGEGPFAPGAGDRSLAEAGFVLACPVREAGRTIALLALGPRAAGAEFGPEERGFIESVGACAATPIENGLIYEELRQVNRSLSVKVYQLHSLFDVGRELTASLDDDAIARLVTTYRDGTLPRHPLRALPARGDRARPLPRAGDEAGRGAVGDPGRRGPPAPRGAGTADGRRSPAGRPPRVPLVGAVRPRGAARGRGPPERPRRGGGAARWPPLRRGRPRLRRRPRAAGPGRARRRPGPPPPPREGAPGPRPADRPRDPAEPVPAQLAPGGGLRGRGAEPVVLPGGRRLLRLHPSRRRAAGARDRRRVGQGDAGEPDDGVGPRVAPGHGRLRAAAAGARASQPVPVREHPDEPLRHALLRGARPRAADAHLRERGPRPALPPRGRAARNRACWPAGRCSACSRT